MLVFKLTKRYMIKISWDIFHVFKMHDTSRVLAYGGMTARLPARFMCLHPSMPPVLQCYTEYMPIPSLVTRITCGY